MAKMAKIKYPRSPFRRLFQWFALIVLLAACTTPTPPITPAPTLEPAEDFNLPEVPPRTQECFFPQGFAGTTPGNPGEDFVLDQVVFTGSPDEIERIVSNVQDFPEFSQGEQRIDPLPAQFEFQDLTGQPLEVRLYGVTLPDGESIWNLVQRVNEFAETNSLRVLAEPNYITNLPVGGSGPDGGSGISGSPDPNSPMTPADFGKDQFNRQWAFSGPESIRLFDDNLPHNWTPGRYTGSGVRIVVFDTTPLLQGTHPIDWAVLPFELCVWQPGLRFPGSAASPVQTPAGTTVSKAEHGLFVSGMAHGLAPGSEYYLVEVLNDQAQGDIYTLVRGIALFMSLSAAQPMKTVFNLSLGLQIARSGLDADPQNALDALKKNLAKNFPTNPTYAQLDQLEIPVASLKAIMAVAEQQGIVTVAASGNDRGSIPQTPSHAPASFPEVLGVASSNNLGDASCFSNPGDVAAPSGDGAAPCREETSVACAPGNATQGAEENAGCVMAVISTVTTSSAPSGYAYWTGTSFSTPIVSGLAALVWEAAPGKTPEQVREAITDCGVEPGTTGPILGAGLVNVEKMIADLAACP
jgi:hypothetical protein